MKNKVKRFTVILLSVAMMLSQMSVFSFAFDETPADAQDQQTVTQEVQAPAEAEDTKVEAAEQAKPAEEAAPEAKAEEKAEEPAAPAKTAEPAKTETKEEAFDQSKTVDGVKVTVKAAKGVFPVGSKLSVEKVKVPKAVDTKDAAEAYAFDISILADGKKIQPDGKAEVSFKTDEVAKYDTEVFHMDGNKPEELDVTEKGKTASVEAESFSVYVVKFLTFYNNTTEGGAPTYTLGVGNKAILVEILDALGKRDLVGRIDFSKTVPVKGLIINHKGEASTAINWYVQATDAWADGNKATLVFKDSDGADVIAVELKCEQSTVTEPEPEDLVYNGSDQPLLSDTNKGSATNGVMQYWISGGSWGTAVPTGKEVGTYQLLDKALDMYLPLFL